MDIVWTEEGNKPTLLRRAYWFRKSVLTRWRSRCGTASSPIPVGAAAASCRWPKRWRSTGRHSARSARLGGLRFSVRSEIRTYSFFREHFDLFRGVRSRPDVAVLHSYASMGYNNDLPWQSAMLVEQALIQNHVPFDIVFDDQLRDLSRYRALVLPDQECLTDAQMALIRQYVEGGGGLVATERRRSMTPGAAGAPISDSATCSVSRRRSFPRICTRSVPCRSCLASL